MLITTSRKPSVRTRSLCKLISRFIAGRCITRGKMGMKELLEFADGGPLIIIGEYHGNPGELSFYDENGKLLFSIRFTDWYSEEADSYWFPGAEPALSGQGEIADAFESFFQFKRVESDKIDQLPPNSTLIVIREEYIDFIGSGKSLFKLNLRGFKKY
ncbi:U3 small nucleolar ribonucleoprotein protein IMP4 [Methanosarcina thermophila]|jgi:U3 small nucleolar ribonucleoprotein protein IMP4|nr:rRNA maturation protein [Methanosarcina thermophila]NLU57565.1 rRNA maturation protein [Methanosarcina thermophila]SFT56731.1 U3 small nucleolar ribonucleoprotein protein IMP4 [Methanosarcina thermophila]HOA68675.1 rRNA maturation protein [Methanosarcina thermophila]HOQ65213.1 rRNA maturation protein [Methanosarcina thermophila]HPT80724.1 rRNA maturation protein [Methanosarcina thermophila]